MPPKAVNALEGIDVPRNLQQLSAAAKALAEKAERERPPEKKGPETKTALLLRKGGGVKKAFKETAMTLDASNVGNCTFSDGGEICVRQALVDAPWVFEEKTGQKYLFSITDVDGKSKNQEILIAPTAAEFDKWLTVMEGHGAIVHRPVKMGSMHFLNNKKKEEAWFVLYPDGLQVFKQKTDSKPSKVVSIGEANEIERTSDGFILAESGDELANSITCVCNDADGWYEAIGQEVTSKRRKKHFDSIKEGYLQKCNADMKFWKKRYCVLMPDHIKYFKKRFDEQPAGMIGLPPGAEAEDVDDSVDPSRPNMFWVAENGDETGTRRYPLIAPNAKEKELWLQALFRLFSHRNFRQHPLSLQEGYLYHLSPGTTNLKSGKWSKHFFVLLKDNLLYFKKRHDQQPQGLIDLKQGAEFAVPFMDSESPFERNVMTIAENGDEQGTITHYMRANDEASLKQWMNALMDLLTTKDVRVHMQSVKEGYMYKQNTRQVWNKRYFILLDNKLLYYKKRQDKSEAGEIPLPGSGEITCVTGEDPNYKWMFTIAESGDEAGVRTYYVACATEALRTQWVNVLTKIIKSKDSRILMGSLLEGYLWKCPEGGGVWRKRYFVLKQNQLMYFRKRADPSSAGCIEVKGEAQISTIDDDPEHPYSFSVAKNGDEGEREVKIYALDAITREEWVRCLRKQVAMLAVKTHPDSVREGYVNLLTALGWRRKFYVLDKDQVRLFSKRHDHNPSSTFLFDDRTVVLLQDNSKNQISNDQPKLEQPPPDGPQEEEKKSISNVDEKKPEGEIGEEDVAFIEEFKSTGASILLRKNGDQNARQFRLKVIYDSEANFVTDAMTVCISKEFPPVEASIIKSGYVSVRHKASGLAKADRWVLSYVTLTTDDFFVFKARDDEFPVFSANVDIAAMFYAGPVPGTAIWNPLCMTLRDSTEREISFAAASLEEKNSWMSAVLRSIELFKEKRRPSRVDLFGGELKTTFAKSNYYGLPSVVAACVDFLNKNPVSYCLLRMPGSHILVRSLIQDLEYGLDVTISDGESVAACLRLYLLMLKKPIIPDTVTQSLFATLITGKNSGDEVIHSFQRALSGLDPDNATTLALMLHFLSREIKRPEEIHLTPERVAAVWSPLIMRFKEEDAEHSAVDLSQQAMIIMLRNLEALFPGEFAVVRKLSRKQLQKVKAENASILNYEVLRGCWLGKELFGRFVKENHIDEDVLFLAAVAQYKELCENSEIAHAKRHSKGLEIYAKFVKQGAETQVNVADATSKLILERFEGKNPAKVLSGGEFLEAETQAILLINTNSWPRFKQSEAYEHWITYREQLKHRNVVKSLDEPDGGSGGSSDLPSPTVTPRGSPRHSFADDPPPPPPDDDLHRTFPPFRKSEAPPPPDDLVPRKSEAPPPPTDTELPTNQASPLSRPPSSPEKSAPRRQAPVARAPTRPNLQSSNSVGSLSSFDDSTPTRPTETPPSPIDSGEDMPPPPPEFAEEVYFVRKTTKGVPYYIHTTTKQTTYTAPDALIYSYAMDESGRMCFKNNKDESVGYEIPECLRAFALTYKLT